MIVVAGHPAEGCRVPRIAKKGLEEVPSSSEGRRVFHLEATGGMM